MALRILFHDNSLVVIDKPAGFFVHPPEDTRFNIKYSINCMAILRDQIGAKVFPVHRLDRATSGVTVFALSSEIARQMQERLQKKSWQKIYWAVVRGWLQDPQGVIAEPLQDKDQVSAVESKTIYQVLKQIEVPGPVGRYETARYSLVQVIPETGRYHQIRRHFAHIAHPLIGDKEHGDRHHNRFFANNFGSLNLLLKAQRLIFPHPVDNEVVDLESKWTGVWHRIFDLFKICPRRTAEVFPLHE